MTVPQIKVNVVRKAQIKVKTLVNFPANVVGQKFLTITHSGGTYTFDVDYSILTPGPITDPTTAYIAVNDVSAGLYKNVTLASLLTSSLSADLQAIAALTGAGVLSRTGTGTWALRTLTGTTNEITVTNGDGVAGNETISLPTTLTFTGKTVTGGTFNSPALVTPALGTPTSGVATNLTGTAAGLTAGNATLAATVTTNANMTGDVTSVGNATTIGANKVTRAMQAQGVARSVIGVTGNATANVADIQGTASQFLGVNSAGTALAFQTMSGDATMSGPAITVAANAITNAKLATMGAWSFKVNNTGSAATPTDITIDGLTVKGSPAAADEMFLWDVAGAALKKATVSSISSAGSVSSIAGNTGAFTLTSGITNSTNAIQLDGAFGFRNRVINPSGQVNQAGVGSQTDVTYDFDQWLTLTQTAAVTVSQQTLVENTTPYMMRSLQAQATAQRFGRIQWLERENCIDLRGQAVVLSARVRMSASTTLRYAIIEWTGTADAITKDIVLDWTNATFTAGNFFTTTSTTVTATGSTALVANTLTSISLTGTISASANNIAVFFWTDSTQAQNVTLDIGKVQLEAGVSATPLAIRSLAAEMALCQRYFEIFGGLVNYPLGIGTINASTTGYIFVQYFVPMRIAPTIAATSATAITFGAGAGNFATTAIAGTLTSAQSTFVQGTIAGATAGQAALGLIPLATNFITMNSRL